MAARVTASTGVLVGGALDALEGPTGLIGARGDRRGGEVGDLALVPGDPQLGREERIGGDGALDVLVGESVQGRARALRGGLRVSV
jgi:hypothetical protein